jgi:DNA polymerase III epsilon subunit-like protein
MSEYAERAVIDIETSVIPGVSQFLGEIKAPSNYKNEESIAKYIEKAQLEESSKAALDPDLCRIVAIAFQDVEPGVPLAPKCGIARNEDEERKLLTRFWQAMKCKLGGPKTLIGFNINDFDVVALMRRSLYLGVPWIKYEVGRYRHPRIVDIMQELSYDGKLKYRSLDFYCKRFGIEEPDPLKSGADVIERIAMGDYESAKAHCIADVRKEYRLAEAVGLL